MKVTAILAVRNERACIGNCLNHLVRNGLDFIVIDNESTDGTSDIVRDPHFRAHLLDYVRFPYPGHFDWVGLMRAREAAAQRSGASWVVFVSPDEIIHSYRDGETLLDAIARVSATGADVIDFNEFVFLPVETDYQPDQMGDQPLHHYYFFEPHRPRLMRARRRDLRVSAVDQGGHTFSGAEYTLASESFALRHYIFRDQDHAREKYDQRVFSAEELARGWHDNRYGVAQDRFQFPAPDQLLRLNSASQRQLDRSSPRVRHYWEW